MAKVTCAISGIKFSCSYLPINLDHTAGYYHPIFAVKTKTLHGLYVRHTKGELTATDSYLTFLAFLHSSDQITWRHPATLDPNSTVTRRLVENNLHQLIRVLEKTNCIFHPRFTQPSFTVTYENSGLQQIHNWIKAWEDNLTIFENGIADKEDRESLQKIENRLSNLILSGEKPEKFAHIIASWASKAAEFPVEQDETYQKTIRSCFNMTKMFNTSLALLKEIKEYCESNIEAGSIHFHTLSAVLKEGIRRHHDYLGGSSLALGYTLLPTADTVEARDLEAKNTAEVAALAAKAPATTPARVDYDTDLDFLRAKLAYRIACNQDKG